MSLQTISIVVGVTGHRDLRDEDIPALKKCVREELERILKEYPYSSVTMLSSLAEGADTLCAKVAIECGISLKCPLPMDIDEYRKDFEGSSLEEFNTLIDAADDVFVVRAGKSNPAKDNKVSAGEEAEYKLRDAAYRRAGVYVADHSSLLIALWDGSDAIPGGCGTAEIVDYALSISPAAEDDLTPVNTGAVFHVTTPRKKNNEAIPVTATLKENQPGILCEILGKIERFNRQASEAGEPESSHLLIEDSPDDSKEEELDMLYREADSLSVKKQKVYTGILRIISVISVILIVSYLLYDEGTMNGCLIVYGVCTAFYALVYRMVMKRNYHGDYLEFRALAELVRIQYYLYALGIEDNTFDYYSWTQKHDLSWIGKALQGVLIGEERSVKVSEAAVKRFWIDGQKQYHDKAKIRNGAKLRTMEKLTKAMIIALLCTWVVVLVLEYFFPSVMAGVVIGISIQSHFKILWGCISAVTVFAAGYYGKMSLERKSIDHARMSEMFECAARRYDTYPDERPELFRQLAKEEILENGNWVSYCRENKPDFTL